MLLTAVQMMVALLVGSLATAFLVQPPVPMASAPTGVTAAQLACEVGADRCDHALLSCLSVQVRFIQELEALQDVCGPSKQRNSREQQ